MIRRFRKRSELEVYNIKNTLNGHIFCYGRIGAGKSVSLASVVQNLRDNFNFKIWDIYGGERNEHLYWTIPSQDTVYWEKIKRINKFDEEGPKQYKVNLLYPHFASKIPKKLPQKKINGNIVVNSKVFTIPLKSVTAEDTQVVVGLLSESNKFAWNEIIFNATKKDNSGSLLELLKKTKVTKFTEMPLYRNFIIPMYREHFLMDSYCDYNLDLISEARDTETISVLCLDFVPKQFHLFVINYLERMKNELLDANKIPRKNISFMREAGPFFRATDDSMMEDRFKIFRINMSNYLRMARRGNFYALDTQSASETKGMVEGSQDYLIMFNTTSFRDKTELTDELKKEKRMLPQQVADLAFLRPGECYIAESLRNVKKVCIKLPRTMYWKREYGNFYKNVWERFGGSWINVEEIKDKIHDSCIELEVKRKLENEKDKTQKNREKIIKIIESKEEDDEDIALLPTAVKFNEEVAVSVRPKIKRSIS